MVLLVGLCINTVIRERVLFLLAQGPYVNLHLAVHGGVRRLERPLTREWCLPGRLWTAEVQEKAQGRNSSMTLRSRRLSHLFLFFPLALT